MAETIMIFTLCGSLLAAILALEWRAEVLGRRHTRQKRASYTRRGGFAFLGGSITYGFGLEEPDTFPALIASQMSRPGANLAVCGDRSEELYGRILDCEATEPEVVFIAPLCNDIVIPLQLAMLNLNRVAGKPYYEFVYWLKRPAILWRMWQRAVSCLAQPRGVDYGYVKELQHKLNNNLQVIMQTLRRRAVFILIPTYPSLTGGSMAEFHLWPYGLSENHKIACIVGEYAERQIIMQVAKHHKATVVDCRDAFWTYKHKSKLYLDDIHLTKEGCRLVADIVVRQLGGDNAHQQ